ncbi:MAG: DUF883 family protein [Desulfopila sp.]
MAISEFEQNKRKLAKDYHKIMEDVDGLISSLPEELDEKTQEARERLQKTVAKVKEQTRERYDIVEEKVQEQVKRTDQLVRDYPYHAAGVSLGVGLLCGLLLRRNR